MPGGRATISTPVEPRSDGIGQRQASVAATEQLLEAAFESGLEGQEGRPELVRDHRIELDDQLASLGDRGAQVEGLGLERLEPDLQLGVLLDRVRIGRPELVIAPSQLRQAAGCRDRPVGRRGRPALGDDRDGRLEGGRVVGNEVVVDAHRLVGSHRVFHHDLGSRGGRFGLVAGRFADIRGRRGRSHAKARQSEIAQSGELHEDALAQAVEPEPRLKLGVIGRA